LTLKNSSEYEKNVKIFYDSFDPTVTDPSKLVFYKNITTRFPKLKIPETVSKLTFGCANPLTYLLEEIESSGSGFSAPLKILDAGGGSGFDAFLLRQILPNAEIFKLDLSHNLLKLGAIEFRAHFGEKINLEGSKTSFLCSNIAKLPIKQSCKFDFIITNAMLNLVKDKRSVLKTFGNILKDGGSLFLCDVAFAGNSLPNPDFYDHAISEGTFFAPTIINELEYSRIIFDEFGFRRIFERHEMAPRIAGLEGMEFAITACQIKKAPPYEPNSFQCGCGAMMEIRAYLEVNVEESPLYLKMLADNALNSVKCPGCNLLYTDFMPYFFQWPEKNLYLHIFPPSLKPREAEFKAQLKMLPHQDKNPALVFGQKSLLEIIKKHSQ